MSIEVELPDGTVADFPDGMSDDDIAAVLRRQFGSEQNFPGMPQGLKQKSTGFDTFQKPESRFSDLGENVPESQPPPLLRRPPGGEGESNNLMTSERGSPLYEAAIAGMSGEGGSFADPNATGEEIGGRALSQAGALSAGAGGAALSGLRGAGAVAKAVGQGGLGYLGGSALEAMGAPPWLGEAVGLTTGVRGVVKAGAKKLLGRAVEKEVESAVKRQAVKSGVGSIPAKMTLAQERAATTKSIQEAMDAGRIGAKRNIPSEVNAAKKAAEVGKAVDKPSGLAAERLRVGAERAGGRKGPLMTSLVRDEAGPVMGEMRGTASELLPTKVRGDIINAMKKLKPGPEREAFVARAKDVKTMRQVEAIRQDLEHLGLLVPAGLGVGALGGFDAR